MSELALPGLLVALGLHAISTPCHKSYSEGRYSTNIKLALP
jgi:hypothetical protein